ncbi:MAG: hypothetical protein E6Q78_15655 [Rhodoferax sp.]|nr:MAG: hypothetical protein E6Q78_15655 [Rhodoferax sp.]
MPSINSAVVRKVGVAVVAGALVAGTTHAQWEMYQTPQPSFFERYILPAVGAGVGGIFGNLIVAVGSKLISAVTNRLEQGANPSAVQAPPQYNLPANAVQATNAVYIPPPPPVPSQVGMVTGVMYAIDRLGPDYSVRETIIPQLGVSPVFQSREKFAIRYTSNLPGVVVIMNVDSIQKTSYLGTFVVQPGAEMRFPQQRDKGMVLDDITGLETYQMLFMACLPTQMLNQPDVAALRGQIPDCGSTSQAEQNVLYAQKGRRAKGTYNEVMQQPDGTRNVVLSAAPYEKGDVTTTTFTINHVPAGGQSNQQWQATPQVQQQSVSGQL